MRLGDLLLNRGLITQQQLEIALNVQKITGQVLGRCLKSLGFISAQELAEVLALQHGIEYVNLRDYPVQNEILKKIPKKVAETGRFLPIEETADSVKVALVDPGNVVALDRVKAVFGKKVNPCLTDEEGFVDTLEKAYFFLENPTEALLNEIIRTTLNTNAVPPDKLPQLVDAILAEAVRRGATDIHISINAGVLAVSYRVDGLLQYAFSLPRILHSGIISRVKILSKLDIAEQRLPQDGSFSFEFLGRRYEIRVSTIPTIDGESLVMRVLLGSSENIYSLSRLGFTNGLEESLKALVRKPNGIILVVGPTGSGKSTTLYSLLRQVDRLSRSVITIEDPVEYRMSFSKQSEVNEKIGYDFALAGRNFMRHDPDIILLGEIRDEETAKIAVRASITGHLVLSTLHTNDAVSAVPRLIDLGADRFMLSTALLAVLSQRLIRKICPYCKESREPTEKEKALLEGYGFKVSRLYDGKGCKMCRNSGYMGRIAIGELLTVNDEIRDMIFNGASFNELTAAARRNGMIPIRVDGLRKVAEGLSTISEVERVVG